jgi:hypothetical protein
VTLQEYELGEEIRGVVCVDCGGSLVLVNGRAYCEWDEDFPALAVESDELEGSER